MGRDGARWGEMRRDGARWGEMGRDEARWRGGESVGVAVRAARAPSEVECSE